MLEKLFHEIKSLIDSVDFSELWRGFHPMKFALCDETRCFFDGEYVEKTDQFLANTSIFYQGEYIAIWNVMEELGPAVLASKLLMLNVYDARRWKRYLVTTYFVMYADGGEKVTLHGDFVLEMDEERKISRILRVS